MKAGNYYPSRDGSNVEIEAGKIDSEWIVGVLVLPVIKAFNNILTESLATKAASASSPDRPAVSVTGDYEREKQVVMELID